MNRTSKGNERLFFVLFIFFILSTFTLLLIPIVENPDYRVRAPEFFDILNNYTQVLSLDEIYVYSETGHLYCIVEASPFSIFANIKGCSLTFALAIARAGLTSFFLICLVLVFKNKHLAVPKISVLYCALLSPGVIFYLNVFSTEALFICLAIFLVTFAWRWYFVSILLFMFMLDIGNSFVFTLFILIRHIVILLKISIKNFLLLVLIISIILALRRNEILFQLYSLSDFGKILSIYNKISSESETTKYPIIVRPIITMMTMIDSKPSGASAFPSSVIFWGTFLWSYAKTHGRLSFRQNLDISSAFAVIVCMTFLLPQYANAKYYIWTIVSFMVPIFVQFGFLKTAIFSTSLTLYVLIMFTTYRI